MNEILICKTGKNRLADGKFPKGISGNPNGRPKNPEMEELRQAIRIARKRNGNRSILVHFVERAYTNDAVLVALIKKLIPDRQTSEMSGELQGIGKIINLIVPPSKQKDYVDRIGK